MKLLVLGFLTFIFLIFLPGNGFCKSIVISEADQYDYAQFLFEQKDYQTAIFEFKRFLNFFPESQYIENAHFYVALSHFELEQFQQASTLFNEIIKKDMESALAEKAYFYQSQAFMKMGNTGYAKIVLQNFLKLTGKPDLKDKIHYNLAQIYLVDAIEGDESALTHAREHLLKISEPGRKNLNTDDLLNRINTVLTADKKDPVLAGVFAVVPGAGYLYCERYKDALVSFLLNVGLMVAVYQAWDHDQEALAGVIGFVATGFYTGNIYGSISSAHKYNQTLIRKMLNHTISIQPMITKENQVGLSLQYRF